MRSKVYASGPKRTARGPEAAGPTSRFLRPVPAGRYDLRNPGALERLVKLAFSRRRKTLRNALQGMVESPTIEEIGLDPRWRPEQVPIESWIALANRCSQAD